jgi:hypothetical protein
MVPKSCLSAMGSVSNPAHPHGATRRRLVILLLVLAVEVIYIIMHAGKNDLSLLHV